MAKSTSETYRRPYGQIAFTCFAATFTIVGFQQCFFLADSAFFNGLNILCVLAALVLSVMAFFSYLFQRGRLERACPRLMKSAYALIAGGILLVMVPLLQTSLTKAKQARSGNPTANGTVVSRTGKFRLTFPSGTTQQVVSTAQSPGVTVRMSNAELGIAFELIEVNKVDVAIATLHDYAQNLRTNLQRDASGEMSPVSAINFGDRTARRFVWTTTSTESKIRVTYVETVLEIANTFLVLEVRGLPSDIARHQASIDSVVATIELVTSR